jgi:hypothetical protein
MESPPAVAPPVGNIDFGQDILSASEDATGGPSMDSPLLPPGETVVEGPAVREDPPVAEGPDIAAPSPANQPKAESTGWTAVRHHQSSSSESNNQ